MYRAEHADVAKTNLKHKVMPNGSTGRQRLYFGQRPAASKKIGIFTPINNSVLDPQAFMVEQDEGNVLTAHYHYVDQFQVIVDGEGTLGRHAVKPFSVHFSKVGTGYGPISPAPCGLKYLTLRACSDTNGIQVLPEAKEWQPPGKKRNLTLDDITADQFVNVDITAQSRTREKLIR